jgi:carbon-monoxide dehydrogenase medium subunit
LGTIHDAQTVDEAVALLLHHGDDAAVLAGGTWVMRAPLREEPLLGAYVSVRGIGEMAGLAAGADGGAWIGALCTHTQLGAATAGAGPLGALAEAARTSAFPAVRNVATLAGNIAARPFPEADLLPPLLAGEAVLELAGADGRSSLDLAAYLQGERPRGELIVGARLPAAERRRSWFARLTVKRSAEYALASVAVSVDLDADGRIAAARVAVGSVGELPCRVDAAEAVLAGHEPSAAAGAEAGAAAEAVLAGRDGLAAPGWYRLAVLPALTERVLQRIAEEQEEA